MGLSSEQHPPGTNYQHRWQGFVPALKQAFEINQRPFRVRGGGKRNLEVRLDGVEGFAEEGGDGRGHEGIILCKQT